MAVSLIAFIVGLTGLVVSSHYFVGGSAALAKHWGMRPGLIGLTVVAFGTSAPEVFVSAEAALKGSPELGIGNALGSNIANIGLVLAVTALFAKLPVHRGLIRLEVSLLVFATLIATLFLRDYHLSHIEGLTLLGCAVLFPFVLAWDMKYQKQQMSGYNEHALGCEDIPDMTYIKATIWLLGGLFALLFSANMLVNAATSIAEFFGVSTLVIGVTIVAVGTSLPELAASITSAIKGHHEMAVGNIVGSNILNIFAVMSLPGIIHPTLMEPEVFNRDVLTMVLTTAILVAAIFVLTRVKKDGKGSLTWRFGVPLLSIYVAYYVYIFITTHG